MHVQLYTYSYSNWTRVRKRYTALLGSSPFDFFFDAARSIFDAFFDAARSIFDAFFDAARSIFDAFFSNFAASSAAFLSALCLSAASRSALCLASRSSFDDGVGTRNIIGPLFGFGGASTSTRSRYVLFRPQQLMMKIGINVIHVIAASSAFANASDSTVSTSFFVSFSHACGVMALVHAHKPSSPSVW